ncbi:hypothetical protein M3I54_09540 [Paraburkholderia sp. CNPSo 3274]|uniref:hypothetical protein n=1 Tax=unclassified Paraburkholderia TaxID=2615204 RepID=UPI0020B6D8FC|nr:MULTISPECIES: hypothetical protein [unclassified Paraburkholderia]MCP3707220.1 hypothetical protein [Paraburkholderia sp. CNPSo 3274]MCP3717646.1 hypothetical protein [Paraburkholderia sp. CNPSo 3281]
MNVLNDERPLDEIARVDVESAQALAQSMDDDGVGVLDDIVPAAILTKLRSGVAELVGQHGTRYFGFSGAQWITGTCLAPLFEDPGLHALLRQLYVRKMGTPPPSDRIYPVMRVLSGKQGIRHSNIFHYDSYAISILLPVLIPNDPGELAGHLVMFPNLRNARRLAIVNIVEKAIMEKMLGRIWRSARVQKWFSAKVVTLKPGNLYFIWGLRSLHANQACAPSSVRCTVLFHFGDPHESSVFKGLSQRLHDMKLRHMARD